jgi:hypothetical protein
MQDSQVPSSRVGSFSSGWIRFSGEWQSGHRSRRDAPGVIVRTTNGSIVDGADCAGFLDGTATSSKSPTLQY